MDMVKEKSPKGFSIIAAIAKGNRGIGIKGSLPWKNKTDMKYFKNITTQRIDERRFNAVIMGRRTFQECLGGKLLSKRINIIITSDKNVGDELDCLTFTSLDNALNFLYDCREIENIYVIGGEMLYRDAIKHKDCRELLINEIDCGTTNHFDRFFPEIDETMYKLVHEIDLGENVFHKNYRKIMQSN